MSLIHQETITRNGLNFRVEHHYDEDHDAPWKECDCHGVVSEWTGRDKRPGEWVLNSNRHCTRFYDAQATMKLAKRDGWGLGPEALQALADKLGRDPTAGEVRAEAVRKDYEYLRAWVNDEWHYIGVVVYLLDEDGDEIGPQASLWGIESISDDYILEVTNELADEAVACLRQAA